MKIALRPSYSNHILVFFVFSIVCLCIYISPPLLNLSNPVQPSFTFNTIRLKNSLPLTTLSARAQSNGLTTERAMVALKLLRPQDI